MGSEPTFYPNDVEAVWQLAEDRLVYIIEAPERAGGGVGMIWVDNPVSEIAKISQIPEVVGLLNVSTAQV